MELKMHRIIHTGITKYLTDEWWHNSCGKLSGGGEDRSIHFVIVTKNLPRAFQQWQWVQASQR